MTARFVVRELSGYILDPASGMSGGGRKTLPAVAYVMDSAYGYQVMAAYRPNGGRGCTYVQALLKARAKCAELNAWDARADLEAALQDEAMAA